MSVLVEAKSFTGKYGTGNDMGDIIHVHMEINNDNSTTNHNKEIIKGSHSICASSLSS